MLKDIPSYARQIKKEDFLIDWNQKSRKIIKKIQGLYPNTYTLYNGKRIKVLEAKIFNNKKPSLEIQNINNEPINDTIPGEIIMINKQDGIIIMANDCPIQIKYAQLEGKKPVDSYTLSVQSKLSVKKILGN